MRDLTPDEVAAMWLHGAEYARTGLSAIDFYARLSPSRKRVVADFVAQMRAALEEAGMTMYAGERVPWYEALARRVADECHEGGHPESRANGYIEGATEVANRLSAARRAAGEVGHG